MAEPAGNATDPVQVGESVGEQLRQGDAVRRPANWDTERSYGALKEIRVRLRTLFRRYGKFRGNKVAYLRSLGVRIGKEAGLFNTLSDYGEEPWLIEIGDRVTIARGVMFLTHDGSSRVFRHMVPWGSVRWGNRFAPIRILDNSFVGVNAVILPGVTIGPNSIVGAAAVVTQDVPPETVVAGNPAKVVATLDEYVARYQEKMVPITAEDRESLRAELTRRFFGRPR